MHGDASYPELGFYGLAGHAADPRALVEEVRGGGDRPGVGLPLSERFNYKDAAVLSGAAAAATSTLGIATAATNHTRHPLVTATIGRAAQAIRDLDTVKILERL